MLHASAEGLKSNINVTVESSRGEKKEGGYLRGAAWQSG